MAASEAVGSWRFLHPTDFSAASELALKGTKQEK
jgi:hypothetical protein